MTGIRRLAAAGAALAALALLTGACTAGSSPASTASAAPSAGSSGVPAPSGTVSTAPARSFVPTVAGLHRVTNATTAQLESGLRKAIADTARPVFPESSDVAVYLDAAGYTSVVVIAASAAADASLRSKLASSSGQDALMAAVLVDSNAVGSADVATSPQDGRLRCGTAALPGASALTQCIWMTGSTIGQVIAFPAAPAGVRSVTGLAAITRTMHAAYEG